MIKRLKKEGDARLKSWFAFLPVVINHELRWLCRVTVKQRYTYIGYNLPWLAWINICFIDDEN